MQVNRRDRVLEQAPLGYVLCRRKPGNDGVGEHLVIVDVNQQFLEWSGYLIRDALIGKSLAATCASINEILCSESLLGGKHDLTRKSVTLGHRALCLSAYIPEPDHVALLLAEDPNQGDDGSKSLYSAQVIKRQNAIMRIYNTPLTDPEQFLDYVLDRAMEFLNSEYGYIFLYDAERNELFLHNWTDAVMDDCRIQQRRSPLNVHDTGNWQHIVQQEKPFILNDFAHAPPEAHGFPPGHVHLRNFLAIPVYFDGEIQAFVGLANKQDGYNEFDANELALLMQSAWFVREARAQAGSKRSERQRHMEVLDRLPLLFCEFDAESHLLFVNDHYCDFFKLRREDLIGRRFLDFVPKEESAHVQQQYLSLTPDDPVHTYSHQVVIGEDVRWLEWQDVGIL